MGLLRSFAHELIWVLFKDEVEVQLRTEAVALLDICWSPSTWSSLNGRTIIDGRCSATHFASRWVMWPRCHVRFLRQKEAYQNRSIAFRSASQRINNHRGRVRTIYCLADSSGREGRADDITGTEIVARDPTARDWTRRIDGVGRWTFTELPSMA